MVRRESGSRLPARRTGKRSSDVQSSMARPIAAAATRSIVVGEVPCGGHQSSDDQAHEYAHGHLAGELVAEEYVWGLDGRLPYAHDGVLSRCLGDGF